MKIVDYVVVWASSEARNLEHVVESAIKDWRQPLWWVSVSSLEEIDWFIKTYYSQAMVKYWDSPKNPSERQKIWHQSRWFWC